MDAIDDLSDYALHNFRIPPDDYELIQRAAQEEVDTLESLKGETDPQAAARVAARQQLVEGRTPQDVAWLKHKAYYRALKKMREQRRRREEAVAVDGEDAGASTSGREAFLASKGAPLDVVPADLIDLSPAEAAARAAAEAAAARRDAAAEDPRADAAYARAAAEVQEEGGEDAAAGNKWWWWQRRGTEQQQDDASSSGKEFDAAWLSEDYRRNPQVVGALAAAFSEALGADVQPTGAAAAAVAQRAMADIELGKVGGTAALRKHAQRLEEEAEQMERALKQVPWVAAVYAAAATPLPQVTVYTAQYQERLDKDRALRRYRAARAGAFWLSLAAALGAGVARWVAARRRAARRKRSAADARAARRAGSVRGRASSIASSEATLPVVLEA